ADGRHLPCSCTQPSMKIRCTTTLRYVFRLQSPRNARRIEPSFSSSFRLTVDSKSSASAPRRPCLRQTNATTRLIASRSSSSNLWGSIRPSIIHGPATIPSMHKRLFGVVLLLAVTARADYREFKDFPADPSLETKLRHAAESTLKDFPKLKADD